MEYQRFKPVMLLALFLPLLMSFAGYLLYYNGMDDTSNRTSSVNVAQSDNTQLVWSKNGAAGPAPTEPKALGQRELSIYVALLAGLLAIFMHYSKSILGWIIAIVLPLGFSVMFVSLTGMKLTLFYLPNLIFALTFAMLIRNIFYNSRLIRFRMVLASILGAGLLAFNIHSLYWLSGNRTSEPLFQATYLSALILLVFVTFGLSLADLIIMRSYQKAAAKNNTPSDEDADEPVDA